MAYKAALFDLDDTLVNSREQKWLQHRTIAQRHYGITITEQDMQRVWGMPLLEMIAETYQNSDHPHVIEALLMESEPEFPKGSYEGAAAAINRLLDAGVEVGVVTSAPTQHARDDLERLGFDVNRLLCILGYDRQLAHKPDPAVFDEPLQMLKEKGIERKDVIYCGDLFVDLHAAKAAGLGFIAVTTGIVTAAEFHELGAENIAAGVVDAIDVILSRAFGN